jgi:hypothetical protein
LSASRIGESTMICRHFPDHRAPNTRLRPRLAAGTLPW